MSSTAVALAYGLALLPIGSGHALGATTAIEPEPHPSWNEPEAESEPADAPESAVPEGEAADASDPAVPGDEAAPADEASAGDEAGAGDEADADDEADTSGTAPLTLPEQNGLGLMIASGAVGAVAWGTMGWRMAIVRNGCRNDTDLTTVSEEDVAELVGSGVGCANARVLSTLAWVLQSLPNSVNWGLAPAAGMLRGEYDAARFVLEGAPDRQHKVFIGVGAGLLGAGAIGRIALVFIRARSLFNPTKSYIVTCIEGDMTTPEEFFDCYARKNMLHFFGHQLTSASVGLGAGLLAYGVSYGKNRKKYEKGQGGQARLELEIAPQLSLHHTGVSATLRF